MQITTNLFKIIYKDVKVLPVFGNHDYSPANDFPDSGPSEIYSKTFEMWKEWIGDEAKVKYFFKSYVCLYLQDKININLY